MQLPHVITSLLDNKSGIVKIIAGIAAGLAVVVGGFLIVQNVFTKAADVTPRDLVINGITPNGAKISWTTDQETQGVVEYGASPTSLNLFAPEAQKTKNHTVELTLLSPGTSYYFQIRIADSKNDNGGVPWTFSTKVKSTSDTLTATPSSTLTPQPSSTLVNPTGSSAFGPLPSSSMRIIASPTPPRIVTPTSYTYIVPTLPGYVCGETDCQKICQKIGYTCSTYDWVKSGCIGKYSLGSCAVVPPTNTPTPTPTITLTPTPTYTPTPTPTNTPTPTP